MTAVYVRENAGRKNCLTRFRKFTRDCERIKRRASTRKRPTSAAFNGKGKSTADRQKVCEQWPKGNVAQSFNEPVRSNLPVLMISGDLDPVAPPTAAAGALRFLPNGRQITIPNTGHYFRFECVDNLSEQFLKNGSAKGLNDSCVKDIDRPPFVTKLPPQLAK